MLENILGSKSKIKILRAMMRNEERAYSLDDVAKLTGLSCGAAYPAIQQMLESRFIIKRKAGKTPLYQINKSHFLMKPVRRILNVEKYGYVGIARRFSDKLGKKGVYAVVLFGSAARGEITEKSDIDILVVCDGPEAKKAEASKIAGKLLEKYDVEISVIAIGLNEVNKRVKKFDNFIINVFNEGILLFGDNKWSGT